MLQGQQMPRCPIVTLLRWEMVLCKLGSEPHSSQVHNISSRSSAARPRDDILFALRLWYVPGVIFTNWSALWTQRAVRLSVFAPLRFPAGPVSMATAFPVSGLAGRFKRAHCWVLLSGA